MGGMSAGFAGKFVQPDIECGAIFRRGLSKTYAHSEARVRVDHARCEIACAATVADADLQLRAIGKRIDRIHVATKQAQFGNARDESLSISDFRNPGLGDKRKSRVGPADRILSFWHRMASAPTKAAGCLILFYRGCGRSADRRDHACERDILP